MKRLVSLSSCFALAPSQWIPMKILKTKSPWIWDAIGIDILHTGMAVKIVYGIHACTHTRLVSETRFLSIVGVIAWRFK